MNRPALTCPRPVTRTPAGLLAAIVLATTASGCASRASRDCATIAGDGFDRLSSAPADAAVLLRLANLPTEADVQWFGQGRDKVMVCDPSNSLVNPGCGGSIAYQFERSNDAWVSKGVLLPICDTGPT